MNNLSQADVLIAGAGPTGLAAALFLARRGRRVRLVDQAEAPAATSRAQVINPRSLELLEPTGVTAAVLREARPIRGVRFYEGWRRIGEIDFSGLPARHAMSVLPQARTEALLTEALSRHGLAPERGLRLEALRQEAGLVLTEVTDTAGRRQTLRSSLLLGADGAHSAVRKALGLGFPGSSFPEAWPLFDVALNDPLDLDHAHIAFVPRGLVFMLALRQGLWRVFGNVAAPLEHLPPGTEAGEAVWTSNFHISHRRAAQVLAGRVALAGDAAHIHSPAGARGMNLGIEDAFVFAACAADALEGRPGRLADYARLRHPLHARVVRRMALLTRLARGRPALVGHLRHLLFPLAASLGPAAHRMRDFLAGIDQPLEIS
ncbi:FAD-dependent oxidoreductase [Roseomonas sp. M0104]|uniref:FAD-dependent oxidoreductase n=1 Tax=Teichococcus coralli TaxID=2545983 RepID=A0A845B4V3_9PROT|nr:FAD-dependent oxidoreductase [Pseudoroseomonas coralli]MXP62221.1 FAD-dependent oxidoreductase [Pseudoroseomonas coralli]